MFFQVRISHVLRFISICGLLIDASSYIGLYNEKIDKLYFTLCIARGTQERETIWENYVVLTV
jgi:hypothetical protein